MLYRSGFRRGHVEGTCPRCGRRLRRKYPATIAVCDCYKYCPHDHGSGPFRERLTAFVPDMNPRTWKIAGVSTIKGKVVKVKEDTEATVWVCNEHSPPLYFDLTPIEVRLS